ncbi:putative ribonuclease H-like domain-containing protein [Tanacetum coccineum]
MVVFIENPKLGRQGATDPGMVDPSAYLGPTFIGKGDDVLQVKIVKGYILSMMFVRIEDLHEKAAPAGEQSGPPASKTTKQLTTKRNQERAAIKSRFGGNDEFKKMQRNILKHQFENFTTAPNESLDKAYDRFQKLISQLGVHAAPVSKEDINQKFLRSLPPSWSQIDLIMRNKPDIDQTDIDDLYNNLRVYEDEMKRSLSSTSNSQNLAFLSSENTSSTNEVSTASGNFEVNTAGGTSSTSQVSSTPGADEVVCSFFAQQTTSPPLDNLDLQQIDQDDSEELDIRWQVSMLTVRVKRHFAKECKSGRNQGKRSYGDNGRMNATINEPSSQALMAQDGLGGYDWSNDFDKLVNYALMAISSSSSSSSSDNEVQNYSKQSLESLESRILGHEKNELAWGEKYEFQNYELKCREVKINNLKMELEKVVKERDELKVKIEKWEESSKGLNKLLNSQMSAKEKNGLDEYAIRKKIIESKTTEPRDDTSESKTSETVGKTNKVEKSKTKINRDKVIIEDWNSDDEDDVSEVNTVSPVKTNETQTSTDHLIKDCDFYAKKSPEPKLKTMVNTGQRVVKPVWDNAKRVNHQKFSNKLKYPQARRTFVPSGVLTRTGLVNPVRPNGKRAVHTISTARPVSTVRPFARKIAQTGSAIRPIYPRMDNVRPRASYSPIKRSYYTRPAVRPKDLKQDVKTSGVKNMTTAGTRAVVNTDKGKWDNALKKSRWVWRPKGNYMDHESKEKGSFILKKFDLDLKNIVPFGDQPNVAGSGPDWMFDLDFLTNTMNYIPVSVENQVNVDAGTQEHYVAGSSEKDKEPTQEYILLPLHPHRPRISVEDVVQAAQEKPSENSPKDNDVQDSEDVAEKEEQHTLTEAEQALKDDLERMIAQEIAAKAIDDATRQAFEEEKKRAAQATSINKLNIGRPSVSTSNSPLVSTANTPYASAASTPTGANTGGSSFVYLGGQIPIDASTLPNVDLPIDPNMPDLEDDSNVFPNDGIFSGAYDDEDVGAKADFNNMDNTIDVSPIPTLRVHKVEAACKRNCLQFKLSDGLMADVDLSQLGTQTILLHSFMDFCLPITLKSAFLYGTIEEEVYVHQPLGFVDLSYPNKVYKVIKALYGLHIKLLELGMETALSFLLAKNDFREVKQQPDGIFISQDKYVADILKKFDFCSIKTATTPIESNKPLVKDEDGVDVDVHVYRSMIGSLMYLTASRPDIMFVVCACARFQVTPKASHLNAVKRIFRYLKHQPKLGLWYPRDSPFELEAFLDSDYGGASLDRKSTTGGCQFLGRRLISWQCKKQTIVANSTTEAEYVAAANCCGQLGLYSFGLKLPANTNTARLVSAAQKAFNYGVDDWIGSKMQFGLDLRFVDQRNMVACLEKTEGNSDFHEIVDFLAPFEIYLGSHYADIGREYLWKLRNLWIEGGKRETEEVKLTDDTKVVEDKGSGDKGGNAEEL